MKNLSILFVIFCCSISLSAQQRFKGVWIANVGSQQVLDSPAHIRECVATAVQKQITDLFVVVWNRGFTMYPSQVLKKHFGYTIDTVYGNRDPLQELITEAHKHKIKVHAWFEFGFSSAYLNEGQHILATKPQWASKNSKGETVVKSGFSWMNGFDPEVQQFMLDLILELVKKYDIDGIQGDDRLPALPSESGYDKYTVNLYKKQHKGMEPPTNAKDSSWLQWRCQLLNAYGKRIYKAVKKIKPKVQVSMSPSIYPWSVDEYLQDWPTWLRQGYVDFVIPQCYRYNLESYKNTVKGTLNLFNKKLQKKIYTGLLVSLADGYLIEQDYLKQMLEFNKSISVAGECYFYWGNIQKYLK
jgi:uncharacterized lipoprotein YddW (UPF0748 family)